MKRTVYQVLARIFGAVLVLVGIGALIGGLFAHSYVTSQLDQEKITMPTEQGIASLPDDAQKALRPYIGQQMTTGDQAQAYANHYIWEHMQTACATVKDANGNALPAVPADQCTYAGIGAVASATNDPAAKAAYTALRASNFQGDALRSMLLTAYAFWLIGTIAIVAAIACLILGVVLLAVGFFVLKDRATDDTTMQTV